MVDPGLYLMCSPVLEVLPYLGDLPGLRVIVITESDGCGWFGWFGGTVACLTMAVGGVDLNEIFSANFPIFVVLDEKHACAHASDKKLQCFGSGKREFLTMNL